MRISLLLAKNFLKIFTRDRQAIFFVLVFPSILIIAFGVNSTRGPSKIDIGVANVSASPIAQEFIERVDQNSVFKVRLDDENTLLAKMKEKKLDLFVVFPENFSGRDSLNQVDIKTNSSQAFRTSLAIAAINQEMNEIERELLGAEPMFQIVVEDVQVNSLRYIDFVLPGLIAMLLMNISLSGSGSNTVEYRRKGILKRLFVTPIRPSEFILGVVLARSTLSMGAVFLSIAIAVYAFEVQIAGSLLAIILVVLMGLAIFLCIGFTLGSWAKSQQSIQGLISLVTFPQILLSGIFFPIDTWPAFIQPIANLLPLTFVATALREIFTNGLNPLEIWPAMLGIVVWLIAGFFIASRYFVWKEVAN